MNKLRSITLALALAGSTLAISACGAFATPCATLPAASDRDRQAAAEGYEVERTDQHGYECELNRSGYWTYDD